MSSASVADRSQPRHFDPSADRRARRTFGMLVVAFALLAILGGIFAAWLLLDDEAAPSVVAIKPKAPEAIEEHPPLEPWAEPAAALASKPRAVARLADSLGDGDLRRMLAKLQAAFDACARTHGAVEGTVVELDFSVAGTGRVDDSASRPPFASTPLGQCVAAVVRERAVFAKTRLGRRDIHWAIHLRP